MSVNNTFIAVDWARLDAAPKDNELASYLLNAIDAAEEWLCPVPFGDQIDHYYFESWNGLAEFNDWFWEIRKNIDVNIAKEFSSLFMEIGLLHRDDTFAPALTREGFELSSDWLLASIPPNAVANLAAKAEAIDLERVAQEFQGAIIQTPCEIVPDGTTVSKWILSLRTGLRSTADSGRGIIIGAA